MEYKELTLEFITKAYKEYTEGKKDTIPYLNEIEEKFVDNYILLKINIEHDGNYLIADIRRNSHKIITGKGGVFLIIDELLKQPFKEKINVTYNGVQSIMTPEELKNILTKHGK